MKRSGCWARIALPKPPPGYGHSSLLRLELALNPRLPDPSKNIYAILAALCWSYNSFGWGWKQQGLGILKRSHQPIAWLLALPWFNQKMQAATLLLPGLCIWLGCHGPSIILLYLVFYGMIYSSGSNCHIGQRWILSACGGHAWAICDVYIGTTVNLIPFV